MRHLRNCESHLNTAQRTAQRQVIEKAEVSDAEHTTDQLAQTHAKRHVVAFKDLPAQRIRIMAFRHQHRSQHAAVFSGIAAQDLEAPGADRAARRFGMPIVTREDVVNPSSSSIAVDSCRPYSRFVAGV